jgi:hypothetical protein
MLQGARRHGSGARDANKKVPGWRALLEFFEFRNLPVGVCVEHFANHRQLREICLQIIEQDARDP